MMGVDLVGAAPFALLTGAGTWLFQGLAHRREIRKMTLENTAQIETSRDGLAIELLSSARSEVMTARAEMEGLREEIKSLRPLEQHFYHFQQALDHLAAVLNANDVDSRAIAERNARAFLARMNSQRAATSSLTRKAS